MITAGMRNLIAREVSPWAVETPVRLGALKVTVWVAHLLDEQQRRADAGLGAIGDPDLLRTLSGLPTGMPVPLANLSEWDRKAISRSPKGAVEWSGETVTRLASQPVKVELIAVRAREWEPGIFQASQYGPFCRRVLVLPVFPSRQGERDGLQAEAGLFGIGVLSERGAGGGWLAPPAPFRPSRLSSGQWLFQERAYSAILKSGQAPRLS